MVPEYYMYGVEDLSTRRFHFWIPLWIVGVSVGIICAKVALFGGEMDCVTALYAGVVGSSLTEKEQILERFFLFHKPLYLHLIGSVNFQHFYSCLMSNLGPRTLIWGFSVHLQHLTWLFCGSRVRDWHPAVGGCRGNVQPGEVRISWNNFLTVRDRWLNK